MPGCCTLLHTISWLLSSVPEPEVTCSLMYSLPLDIDGSVGRAPSKEGALVDSYSKTRASWDVSGVYPAESLSSHIELPAVMASPLSCPIFALLSGPIFCASRVGTRGKDKWFVPACGYQEEDDNAVWV